MESQSSNTSLQSIPSAPVSLGTSPAPSERIYSLREVKSLVGNPATSTLYRWIDKGIFPKQRRIGINRVGWLHSEVMEFISQCEAA